MTDKLRIRLAAAVTALFLAGVSGAGVAAHGSPPPAPTTAASQSAPAAPSANPGQAPATWAEPNHAND